MGERKRRPVARPEAVVVDTKGARSERRVILPPGRLAIPESFKVWGNFGLPEPFVVELDVRCDVPAGVEVRAWARRVAIETDRVGGVSSTLLRSVPIRDLVAEGCLRLLERVETEGRTARWVAIPDEQRSAEDVRDAVKRLVGYVEVGS